MKSFGLVTPVTIHRNNVLKLKLDDLELIETGMTCF